MYPSDGNGFDFIAAIALVLRRSSEAPIVRSRKLCRCAVQGFIARFATLRRAAAVRDRGRSTYFDGFPPSLSLSIARAFHVRTPNTFAKIATISTPTLIVGADADLLAPPALMRHPVRPFMIFHVSGCARCWPRNRMVTEVV
jgi:pimeloyl-ACP methyl ester carboxylesterase